MGNSENFGDGRDISRRELLVGGGVYAGLALLLGACGASVRGVLNPSVDSALSLPVDSSRPVEPSSKSVEQLPTEAQIGEMVELFFKDSDAFVSHLGIVVDHFGKDFAEKIVMEATKRVPPQKLLSKVDALEWQFQAGDFVSNYIATSFELLSGAYGRVEGKKRDSLRERSAMVRGGKCKDGLVSQDEELLGYDCFEDIDQWGPAICRHIIELKKHDQLMHPVEINRVRELEGLFSGGFNGSSYQPHSKLRYADKFYEVVKWGKHSAIGRRVVSAVVHEVFDGGKENVLKYADKFLPFLEKADKGEHVSAVKRVIEIVTSDGQYNPRIVVEHVGSWATALLNAGVNMGVVKELVEKAVDHPDMMNSYPYVLVDRAGQYRGFLDKAKFRRVLGDAAVKSAEMRSSTVLDGLKKH